MQDCQRLFPEYAKGAHLSQEKIVTTHIGKSNQQKEKERKRKRPRWGKREERGREKNTREGEKRCGEERKWMTFKGMPLKSPKLASMKPKHSRTFQFCKQLILHFFLKHLEPRFGILIPRSPRVCAMLSFISVPPITGPDGISFN